MVLCLLPLVGCDIAKKIYYNIIIFIMVVRVAKNYKIAVATYSWFQLNR